MGQSQAKQALDGSANPRIPRSPSINPSSDQNQDRHSHTRRLSRPDLTLFGLNSSTGTASRRSQRENEPFTHRETRAEREARKLAKEREARVKERERSMREEHVDGGYLVTQGTYSGTEDFNKPIVRQLQIERRLAPFWRPIESWNPNLVEHQLIAAAHGLPIPPADEIPPPENTPHFPLASQDNPPFLTVPMGGRTLSASSDLSDFGIHSGSQSPAPGQGFSLRTSRARSWANALNIGSGSRNASTTDLPPREVHLGDPPSVNGQPLEVTLYKEVEDCSICFTSYPPYLNYSRCCRHPVCSECFVQIKRLDPHRPYNEHDGPPTPDMENEESNVLVSEPAKCPFCQAKEFGVTYDPPPFRRGLVYANYASNTSSTTPMSSQTNLNQSRSTTTTSGRATGRARGQSLSVTAPNVISTDRIRPDWSEKLEAAKLHQARRSAAATALHQATFLVQGEDPNSTRRLRVLALNEETTASMFRNQSDATTEGAEPRMEATRGPPSATSRREYLAHLEETMMRDAIRQSIKAEMERQRKEEKAAQSKAAEEAARAKAAMKTAMKEAKQREKEEKKAAKKQGSSPYGGGASSGATNSSLSIKDSFSTFVGRRRGNSGASSLRQDATVQGAKQGSSSEAQSPQAADDNNQNRDDTPSKGKAVDRTAMQPSTSTSHDQPPPYDPLAVPPSSGGGSHLRQMSNASSIGSTATPSPAGSYTGQDEHDDGENVGEMFNFTSIAAIVGVDLDNGSTSSLRPLSQVKEEEAAAEHVDRTSSEHRRSLDEHAAEAEETKVCSSITEHREPMV